jgi:broad specificity phosphatase PhoE
MIIHKPFYFVRHGETDYNKKNLATGQHDVPLNDTGIAQAQEGAKHMKDKDVCVVSSPLLRCRQTAEVFGDASPYIINDLQEACWGVKDGVDKGDGQWLRDWKDGAFIEEAETYPVFRARVLAAINKALALTDKIPLIISHGGVCWAIQNLLTIPPCDVANAMPLYHRPPEGPNKPWFVYPVSDDE